MADDQNPYQPPATATAEEVGSDPTVREFKIYLLANQLVSTAMIALGIGLVGFSVLALIAQFRGGPRILLFGLQLDVSFLLILGLVVATVGFFQRKHDPTAMLYSAVFSLVVLVAFATVLLYGVGMSVSQGKTGPVNLISFGGVAILICVATWVLTGPSRVLLQAWRFRRHGINVADFERHIERRP